MTHYEARYHSDDTYPEWRGGALWLIAAALLGYVAWRRLRK
jgi:hypothetical protein